jgi:hypothetical protein
VNRLDRVRAEVADLIYRAANAAGGWIGPRSDYARCEICRGWLTLDEARRGEIRWRVASTFADSGDRGRSWWPIHAACRARMGLLDSADAKAVR